MKRLPFLCLFLLPLFSQGQYWQQEANYSIDVKLNDATHTLSGHLNLEYINHSPDTLRFIWFHLWPNAYSNEQTAYGKQIFRNRKEGKRRWKDMKDKGSIDSLLFKADDVPALTETDPANPDITKLLLPAPLPPGASVKITTPFFVRIPTYSSRSGHLGNTYMICQWYPKPAVYDRKGWHPIPYLDQGEFYAEYGNFTVNITLPSHYVVGASGELKNEDELNYYREVGRENNLGKKEIKYMPAEKGWKTLRYTATNVHDFAWFADKDFIIRYDTAQLSSGAIVDVFTYGRPDGNRYWKNSVSYTEDAIRSYSSWIGEYPYPVVQAVEGPRNVMSGGMEYPMITLITSPGADEPTLDGVIAHEVGHNWFYSVIGSNERDHAWMDEGINTYYQFRYEAGKYRANSVFGNQIPTALRSKPVDEFLHEIYNALAGIPMEQPIATGSAAFPDKDTYGVVVYLKTAIWMYLFEATVGREALDRAIQAYYQQWKFKHPYPEDFKTSMEATLNSNLDPLFELLNKKGNL